MVPQVTPTEPTDLEKWLLNGRTQARLGARREIQGFNTLGAMPGFSPSSDIQTAYAKAAFSQVPAETKFERTARLLVAGDLQQQMQQARGLAVVIEHVDAATETANRFVKAGALAYPIVLAASTRSQNASRLISFAASDEPLSEGVVKAACNVHPIVRKGCIATRDFVAGGVNAVTQKFVASPETRAARREKIVKTNVALGIAREQTEQYFKDCETGAPFVLNLGVGMAVGPLAKGVSTAGRMVMKGTGRAIRASGRMTLNHTLPETTRQMRNIPIPIPKLPQSGFSGLIQSEYEIQATLKRKYVWHRPREAPVELPFENLPLIHRRDQPMYFHATKKDAALSIVKEQVLKRKDMGEFAGAFVSTKPESNFGNFTLVFRRSIERLPVINAEKHFRHKDYWVGFATDVPVNSHTLECIGFYGADNMQSIQALAREFSEAAGREIRVRPIQPIIKDLTQRIKRDGIAVPADWPKELNL